MRDHINKELRLASEKNAAGLLQVAFAHLKRAHILGQASTYDHTRIHWSMFKLGLRMGCVREVLGQIVRIIGAATKTPLGIYPVGNTGDSDVWFFKPMPIPDDLQEILDGASTQ